VCCRWSVGITHAGRDMYANGQTVLGLITARGGSKGVPKKNIRMVGGKPLIAWTIDAGKASIYLDRLILSSDDDEIIGIARHNGCEVPFKRDPKLSMDETPSIDVVLDALDRCPGFDWVVLLQPTSPLRTGEDIDSAIEKCMASNAPACVSVCEAAQSPYWMFHLTNSRLAPVVDVPLVERRQDLPKAYALNGAVYVASASWLAQQRTFVTPSTVAYEMPRERSVDVDTETDFDSLSTLFRKREV
jgi:CMP-N,N'-diacetyllegionaminic acid synthase